MHDNPPNEALSGAFLRLVRGLRLLERSAKCCEGVTLAQCTLLETLRAEGSQRQKALAARLGVRVSTATRLVDTAERQGLVARLREPDDARGVRVALTQEGERMAEKLSAAGAAFCTLILEALPKKDRIRTVATVAQLSDVIESLPVAACCG